MLPPRCFDLGVSIDVPEEYNAELKVKRILGLVNKLSSIFGWLRLRLAVSAQHQKSTSLCAPFLVLGFLASLVLAGAKTKPNFFTSP
ncbi:hypothetical protein ES703_43096 [subsurface metagenome]